jgi:hypothetical protein
VRLRGQAKTDRISFADGTDHVVKFAVTRHLTSMVCTNCDTFIRVLSSVMFGPYGHVVGVPKCSVIFGFHSIWTKNGIIFI